MSEIPARFDPLLPERPWTVCFYSFRGGVGRTTLAVSTALSLPRLLGLTKSRPRQEGVCLLDFDLEAPGVDEFELLRPPAPTQPGLVEYVRAYRDAGADEELAKFVYSVGKQHAWRIDVPVDQLDELTSSRGVALDVNVDDEATIAAIRAKGEVPLRFEREQLIVMRAGLRDREYRKFLAEFNWHQFYNAHDGYLFFENMRAGIKKELDCDYLVIDSRTGLTHIGGVCIGHLADCVVLVFQPSTAHARGLVDIVQVIREREQREQRPIMRLYAASKVQSTYNNELDIDATNLAINLVKQCEGDNIEVREWEGLDATASYGACEELSQPPIQGRVADLFYFPLIANMRDPHLPDTYLSPVLDDFRHISPNERTTGLLTDAIRYAREYAERFLQAQEAKK